MSSNYIVILRNLKIFHYDAHCMSFSTLIKFHFYTIEISFLLPPMHFLLVLNLDCSQAILMIKFQGILYNNIFKIKWLKCMLTHIRRSILLWNLKFIHNRHFSLWQEKLSFWNSDFMWDENCKYASLIKSKYFCVLTDPFKINILSAPW